MKNNKIPLIISLMMLLCLSSIVYGAGAINEVTIQTPANLSIKGGTSVLFSVKAENATNATFFYSASAGGARTVLCHGTNTSLAFWNCTADVSGITDGTYKFGAQAYNVSNTSLAGNTVATANRTIYFDSNAPTVALSTTYDQLALLKSLPYTCTATDSFNSSPYNNVTLKDPDGTTTYTTTTIANNDIDGTYFDTFGEYNLTCLSKDALQTGASSVIITVDQDGRLVQVTQATTLSNQKGKGVTMYLFLGGGALLLLVMGVGAYLMVGSPNRKSSRRRK